MRDLGPIDFDRRPRDYYDPDLGLDHYERPRRQGPAMRPAVSWEFLLGLALGMAVMLPVWALVVGLAWLLIE